VFNNKDEDDGIILLIDKCFVLLLVLLEVENTVDLLVFSFNELDLAMVIIGLEIVLVANEFILLNVEFEVVAEVNGVLVDVDIFELLGSNNLLLNEKEVLLNMALEVLFELENPLSKLLLLLLLLF
jgi:hypothetical protein